MTRKSIELKDVTASGEVEALVATLDVVDKDGDLTEKGFFGTQPTKIVSSHDWSDVLLGKGSISDDSGAALFRGLLNLDDPAGEQLHTKLRFDLENPPALIEWSYGFKVLDGGSRRDEKDGRSVRILQPRDDGTPGAKVYEVSPVLVGAGEGTGTLAVKSGETISILEALAADGDADAKALIELHRELDQKSDGERFVEQADRVAVAIDRLLDRADEIAALRKDGTLGAASVDRLAEIRSVIRKADARLAGLLLRDPSPDAAAEYLRFVRTTTA